MFDLSSAVIDDIVHRLLLIILIVVTCVVVTKLSLGAIRRLLARNAGPGRADARATSGSRSASASARSVPGRLLVNGFVIDDRRPARPRPARVNVGPAIAGLGVVGIAIAFGAQAIVRDFFSGILILFENQYARATWSRSPA